MAQLFRGTTLSILDTGAAAPNPLERFKPVPSGETIPTIDFFRPRLFSSPALNPAGTHFAAIVATKEDTHELMVVDLATRKIERVAGGSDFDLANFYWLNDRRLFYSLTFDKLYAGGLYVVELGKYGMNSVLQRYSVVIPIGFPKKAPLEAIVWMQKSASKLGSDGGIFRINTSHPLAEHDNMAIHNDDGLRASVVRSYPRPLGGEALHYLPDIEGELAYTVTTKDGHLTLQRLEDDHWEVCPVDLEKVEIVQAGEKPNELLAFASVGPNQPYGLYRLNAVDGKLGELIYKDEKSDLANARIYRHPVDHSHSGIAASKNDAGECVVRRELSFDPKSDGGGSAEPSGADRRERSGGEGVFCKFFLRHAPAVLLSC